MTGPRQQSRIAQVVCFILDLAAADAVYICNAERGCRKGTVVPAPNS